ncbi:MAG: SpoIIE family protein phosphatase [bacterium]|nr:SpoIIE family protein phosphatase [bacterium]
MRFFYFLARHISYTFAISFITVLSSWVAVIFGFFLASSFIVFHSEKPALLNALMIRWLFVSVIITSFIHYLQFGFLTPIKIPAFLRSLRMINRAFKSGLNIADAELKRIYSYFSDLPMHNLIISAIYVMLACAIFMGFIFLEFKFGITGKVELFEVKEIFKVVFLGMIIVIILYGMATYLLTESLTSNERAQVYNLLLKKGMQVYPRVLIGIRVKFSFFIILMVITLLTLVALIENINLNDQLGGVGEQMAQVKGLPAAESGASIRDSKVWVIAYFAISIIASFLLMWINTASILKIMSDMRRVTKEIASGGRAAFNVLSLEREFASIEFALMEMAWEIDEHRKNLESKVELRTGELQDALIDLKGKDDLMQKQLDMASVIQRSILPGKIDDWNELKFSVRYIAMEKIGGDFYDIHQLKGDKLGIMVADVSGHGIPAALVTTMAKISFGNAGSKHDSPRRIFQEVNQNILDHVKTHDYMTCFMVAIDEEYNLVYSNASHQKAILLRMETGTVELLDTGGLFIGAISEARDSYEEKTATLNYGDRLILYTDGIPEAFNEDRKEYSIKRLETVICENKHLPLEEYANYLIEDVQRYIGNAQVEDDITLLVIELARDEAIDIVKNSRKLLNTHKYYEAISLLEGGLDKFPENQKILYNLGKNYFRVNNYNKSIEFIERYIANDKRNKYAFYIGGAAYFQLQDYKNAIEYLEDSLKIDSVFVAATFALAMTYKKMGDREMAVKIFEKVISIDSDNKMALFELKTLREEEDEEQQAEAEAGLEV